DYYCQVYDSSAGVLF
nr:immunoglobulin light chain junction region [Macaca mulatta]MOV68857.1 immunoglobulin light chain junction region [Macaca mulatta]MOV69399.1 immunoglobulin light chain junction region [Macaca mulatta]